MEWCSGLYSLYDRVGERKIHRAIERYSYLPYIMRAMCTSWWVIYLWHQVLCMCFRFTVYLHTRSVIRKRRSVYYFKIQLKKKTSRSKKKRRKNKKEIAIVDVCASECVSGSAADAFS